MDLFGFSLVVDFIQFFCNQFSQKNDLLSFGAFFFMEFGS